jgi:hypothetical protein
MYVLESMLLLRTGVTDTSDTHNNEVCDILIKFMERKEQGILTFLWLHGEDKCRIAFAPVLCTLPAQSLHGRNGWRYGLEHSVTYMVRENFLQYTEKRM